MACRPGPRSASALAELSPDVKRRLNYRFKYFQDLEGTLLLPEGFVPSAVVVEMVPRGHSHPRPSRTFPWTVDMPAELAP